jgi:phosphatidylserine decarboxylase
MSPLDVHVNRAPVSGRVESVRYFPGKFHAAWKDKASLDNEQVHVEIAGAIPSLNIRIKFIAGWLARRVVCRLKAGDPVMAGERIGIIKFGSRAEVFLPAQARIWVRQGDRVKAGESILAYFKNTEADIEYKDNLRQSSK